MQRAWFPTTVLAAMLATALITCSPALAKNVRRLASRTVSGCENAGCDHGCDHGCDCEASGCDKAGCDGGCDGGCGCGTGGTRCSLFGNGCCGKCPGWGNNGCGCGGGLLGNKGHGCGCGGGLLGKKGHGCGCGGLLGRGIAGWDAGYNCGCNGSYNYPVPPLYTYHWPGMYKQQLMTEYDSPWRFPPLKPYEDEQVEGEVGGSEMARQPDAGVLPISYEQSTRSSWRERSVSELLQNMSR